MRKTKRVLAFVLATLMLAVCFAGCGSNTTTSEAGDNANKDSKVYNIGISQLIQHEALDAATQGFQDALKKLLGEDKVKFDLQNAQGDSTNCATIANQFVSSNVDLIMCNGTGALQAAFSATQEIPILGTSITEYGVALDISDWDNASVNVSGTSDLAPLDKQAEMLNELFPDAKKVGILYCSAEPNSKFQATTITDYLKEYGYEVTEYTFADSNDVSSVVTSACEASDVLYVPTDNTAASNSGIINNVAEPAGVPIIAGEEGICSGCGVATLSISYYDLGYKTGEMAYDVLVNGKDIKTMKIEYAPATTKKYDADRAKALGVKIPDDYEAIVSE